MSVYRRRRCGLIGPTPRTGGGRSAAGTAGRPGWRRIVAGTAAAAILAALAAWRLAADSSPGLTGGVAVPAALAIVALVAAGALKPVVWRLVADGAAGEGPRVRLADLAAPTFVGYLLNTFLPARAGEPVRLLLAHRRLESRGVRLGGAAVLGSALVEALIATLTGSILVLVALALVDLPPYAPAVATGAILGCCLIVVFAIRGRGPSPARPRGRAGRAIAPVRGVAAAAALAIRALRRPRPLALAAAASACAWLLQWAAVRWVLEGFGVAGGWEAAGAVLVALTLAQLMPFLPGNLGSFQAAVVLALATGYGVSPADAIGVAVGLHAVQLVAGALPGLACLAVGVVGPGDLRRAPASEARMRPGEAPVADAALPAVR